MIPGLMSRSRPCHSKSPFRHQARKNVTLSTAVPRSTNTLTKRSPTRRSYIVGKEGGMDMTGAKAYLARLAREGRYARDVY